MEAVCVPPARAAFRKTTCLCSLTTARHRRSRVALANLSIQSSGQADSTSAAVGFDPDRRPRPAVLS
jgi:hypothetical protein